MCIYTRLCVKHMCIGSTFQHCDVRSTVSRCFLDAGAAEPGDRQPSAVQQDCFLGAGAAEPGDSQLSAVQQVYCDAVQCPENRRQKMAKKSRFLRQDVKEKKKLRDRHYNRTQRRKHKSSAGTKVGARGSRARRQKQKQRNAKSRAQHCPCCDKRPTKCSMDFTDIKPYFAKAKFTACAKRVKNSCLMSAGDTADCAAWIEKVRAAKAKSDWPLAWGTSSIVRYFNNPELTQIFLQKKILSLDSLPKWSAMEEIIAERYAAKNKVFGGFYDSPVMTAYSEDNGQTWKDVLQMPSAKRDVLAAKLIWESRPGAALRNYRAEPSREAFRKVYDTFRKNASKRLKGAMGPYQIKCTLDPLVIGGWVQQGHLCCWPVNCPGYESGYPVYFPGMRKSPANKLKALYFFHKEMKKFVPKLCFAETVSHLCWDKRRKTGKLQDSLSEWIRQEKRNQCR
jgi:hypothetical protein